MGVLPAVFGFAWIWLAILLVVKGAMHHWYGIVFVSILVAGGFWMVIGNRYRRMDKWHSSSPEIDPDDLLDPFASLPDNINIPTRMPLIELFDDGPILMQISPEFFFAIVAYEIIGLREENVELKNRLRQLGE